MLLGRVTEAGSSERAAAVRPEQGPAPALPSNYLAPGCCGATQGCLSSEVALGEWGTSGLREVAAV